MNDRDYHALIARAQAKLPPRETLHEVWIQAFESGRSRCIGSAYAVSFAEACDKVVRRLDPALSGPYNRAELSLWGARMYPTEHEARG